jgi:hypothetical protein
LRRFCLSRSRSELAIRSANEEAGKTKLDSNDEKTNSMHSTRRKEEPTETNTTNRERRPWVRMMEIRKRSASNLVNAVFRFELLFGGGRARTSADSVVLVAGDAASEDIVREDGFGNEGGAVREELRNEERLDHVQRMGKRKRKRDVPC